MAPLVDLFWSFRSPYSYLATGRLVALAGRGVDVRVRIVQPLAIRDPDFFRRVDPRLPRYVQMDAARVAAFLGLPFAWPRPDPVVMDMRTLRIADDQPYIHRLSRLGALAAEEGRGLAFIDQVSRLIWGGTEGWNEGAHLAEAAACTGLDLGDLDRLAEAEAGRLDAVIAANHDALAAAGHWGVPTMVLDGEPFFGQDRIDLLEWRLGQLGYLD